MKKLKKIIGGLLALTMCIGSMAVYTGAETAVQLNNITWNMSAGEKSKSYSESFEWNGLSVVATTAKTVTFDGTYMKTSGGANTISFKAASPCTITIVAKNNSNSTARSAVLSRGEENLLTLDLPTTQKDTTGSANYDGYGETLTVAPSGGGISIKSITITYNQKNNKKGDINGDGAVNALDAVLALRHIMGLDIISDTAAVSAANGNNDGVVDIRDASWILSNTYEPATENTTAQTVDTSDGKEVKTYAELTAALSSSGAKAYVMNDIEMEDIIQLTKGAQSIIGVPKADGTLPVLDFENMKGKNDIINSSSSDSDVGVRIRSANNTVKNLVIEKAHDNGIQIKGVGADNNLVENCILRYNNDSGIQVTGGACATTLRNVYSYRNCDVYTRGSNADGFALKLSAGPETTTDTSVMEANKIICENCYSWENGDDGWDSFDYPENQQNFTNSSGEAVKRWTYRIDYTNDMCWNNGTPENCMGYTDYANGLELDENLPFIRRFKEVYPDNYDAFVTSYNNGTLCSRTAASSTYFKALDSAFGAINTDAGSLTPSSIAASNWAGNPNGFKLGSKYTQSNSQRYMTNCISFNHSGSGFDKNNSGANIWASNCVSFGNSINYHLSGYTAKLWSNIYGWSGAKSNDLPTGGSAPSTSGSSDKQTAVLEAADRLVQYANANKVVASSVFDTVFN